MSKLESYLEEIRNNRQGVKSKAKDHLTAQERRRESRLVNAGNRNAATGDDGSYRDEARRINAEIKKLEEKAIKRRIAKESMSQEDLAKVNEILKDLDQLDYKMDSLNYKKKSPSISGDELNAIYDQQNAIDQQVQALEGELDAIVGKHKDAIDKYEKEKSDKEWEKRKKQYEYSDKKYQEKQAQKESWAKSTFSDKTEPELIKEMIVQLKLAQGNSYNYMYMPKHLVKAEKAKFEKGIRDLMNILSTDYNDNTSKSNITSKVNNELRSRFFRSKDAEGLVPQKALEIYRTIFPMSEEE